MTRMLLLTTLFPCLAADSLRGLGSVPNGNVTSMQKQLVAASSTAGACTAEDQAKMTQLGSGNADGTFPKTLSDCGKRNYNIFSGFNARKFVECVQENTGLTWDCGTCFVGSSTIWCEQLQVVMLVGFLVRPKLPELCWGGDRTVTAMCRARGDCSNGKCLQVSNKLK